MSEWARRWKITILYDRPRGPIGSTRYSTIVDTVAELKELVEQASADPNAWHIRHGSVRMLVGEAPDRCPRGHSLGGGSATRAWQDWLPCDCGGHLLQECGWCRAVAVDPPRGVECVPRLKPGQRLPAAWSGPGR